MLSQAGTDEVDLSRDGSSPWREFQHGAASAHTIPVHLLHPAESPRIGGEDHAHVRALAAADRRLPPIIVHRPTMRVVDGMHRLRAAVLRGFGEVEVQFFDGSGEDAFVLAVEANTANGLPLSQADRRAAAAQILMTHAERSDRWIALVSGLAASTVGAIRRCSTGAAARSNTRVGRDGRVRPLDGASGRRQAGELIRADPNRSVRDVARAAGIAPSTALDVRRRISAGLDPVPGGLGGARGPGCMQPGGSGSAATNQARVEPSVEPTEIIQQLRRDPSLRFNEAGRALLRWLVTHTVEGDTMPSPTAIPDHCVATVVTLARHNARFWAALGDRRDIAEPAARDAVVSRRP